MNEELPNATWKQRLISWVSGSLRPLTVSGNSMMPALNDRDTVLYRPMSLWTPRETVKIGDIVFVAHPYMQSVKIMKRVREIDHEGKLFLVGDNEAESTDSRTLGWFSPKDVGGKVVCRLK